MFCDAGELVGDNEAKISRAYYTEEHWNYAGHSQHKRMHNIHFAGKNMPLCRDQLAWTQAC